MRRIFVSYRRADAAADAGRLNADLERVFGEELVFKDVEDVPLAGNIRHHIETAMRESFIVLALVGNDWDPARLADEDDWVRMELEAAHEHGIKILPVRLSRAELPASAELPPSLAWFAELNAAELEHQSWRRDLDPILNLIESEAVLEGWEIKRLDDPERPTRLLLAGALGALVIAVAIMWALFDRSTGDGDGDPPDPAGPDDVAAVPIRIVSGPNLNEVNPRSFQFNYATNVVCGTGSFVVERVGDGVEVGRFDGEDVCYGPLHGGFPGLPNSVEFRDFDLEPATAYRVLITVRGTDAEEPGQTPGSGTATAELEVVTEAG